MLSERLQTTFNMKKPCEILPNTLGTTLYKSKPYAMVSKRLQTTLYNKWLCVNLPSLMLLRQHCTGQSLILCCLKVSRQHCTRKNSIQCCLKTLGPTSLAETLFNVAERVKTTLQKKKPCAMLSWYSWDKIEQLKNTWNIAREAPHYIA